MAFSDFEFSQGSLQDFVECPRRFQLKYVLRQAWPAVEVEPALDYEVHNKHGREFHQIVERYFLMGGTGEEAFEPELLGRHLREPVRRWWEAFLHEPPLNLPEQLRLPEQRLTVRLGEHRLVAVFDLLAVNPGERLVIVDWKTGRFRPKRREDVLRRLQTRVYPLVCVLAAERFFGGPIEPSRITMVYWYAEEPDQPYVLYYDDVQFSEDRRYVMELIERVVGFQGVEDVWPLTEDERLCRFCAYRSLCGRGVEAGPLDELAVDMMDFRDVEIDVLGVSEVEF